MAELRHLGGFFLFVLYGLVLPVCYSAAVQECGLRNVVNINGSEVNNRYLEYPWHIFLYRQISSDEQPEYICGGSIVHPKLIVTAAHCVYDELKFAITKAELIVAAGKYNRSWDFRGPAEQRFSVAEIKIPETYIGFPGKYRDDIAILILSNSINVNNFAMPICIDWNKKDELVLTNGSVVGWELTENGTLSTKPAVARIEYYDFIACRESVSKRFLGFVSSDKFCGVPSSSKISTRRSDGSGFVIQPNFIKNLEKYYLQGILSAKDRESNLTSYTDLNKHLKWLHSILTPVTNLEIPAFTLDYGEEFRECGIRYAVKSQIPTINYGYGAKPSEFPWHVAIYRQFNLSQHPEYICGGSIVHRTVILTAAHCFYSDGELSLEVNATYTVIAGKHHRSWDYRDNFEQRFKVIKIMIPETYRSVLNRYADDLAILVLNETIRFSSIIMPICINWKPDVKVEVISELGTVVGWGYTENGSLSETLIVAKLKYYNFTACSNLVTNEGFSTFVTSDKFCAALNNGTTVDQGDSGGGLVFLIDAVRKQYFLRGIVSTKDTSGTNIAAFTDISKHMDWLNSRMSPFIDAEYCPVLSSNQVELEHCIINSTAVTCDKPAMVGTTAKVLCRNSFHAEFPFRLYTETECLKNHIWSPLKKFCIDCGKRYSFNDFVPLIVNGPSPVKKSEFPWHVHIYIKNRTEYKYICGGTIIHPKAVLTAAQHFFNEQEFQLIDPKLIYIAAGKDDLNWTTEVSFVQRFQASQIFMKDTYTGSDNGYADNIAILELNATITLSDYIMPACIDWTGKSQLHRNSFSSALILAQRWSVLNLVRCHSLMFEAEKNSVSFLTSDKWCGVPEGQQLPASSSGVSVTFRGYNGGRNREQAYYVYGVVSTETRRKDIVIVTDVLYHIEWIKDIMISIIENQNHLMWENQNDFMWENQSNLFTIK